MKKGEEIKFIGYADDWCNGEESRYRDSELVHGNFANASGKGRIVKSNRYTALVEVYGSEASPAYKDRAVALGVPLKNLVLEYKLSQLKSLKVTLFDRPR